MCVILGSESPDFPLPLLYLHSPLPPGAPTHRVTLNAIFSRSRPPDVCLTVVRVLLFGAEETEEEIIIIVGKRQAVRTCSLSSPPVLDARRERPSESVVTELRGCS